MDLEMVLLYVTRLLVFCTAIPLHEAAHAFVSYKLGDPTAKNLGRLTLNPIKHLDMFGLLSMLVVGIGWAKPVPVDPRYYKDRKKGMALSAAAGPLSNFLLALVVMLLLKAYRLAFVPFTAMWQVVIFYLLSYMVTINITLAIFNLLPVPPFDGSRIFLVFLPDTLYFKAMKHERVLGFVVLALVFFGLLNAPLQWANYNILIGLDKLTGFLGTLYT